MKNKHATNTKGNNDKEIANDFNNVNCFLVFHLSHYMS